MYNNNVWTKYRNCMNISHFFHLLWKINQRNFSLQREVYPCLFISNTQLSRIMSTTGIFLVRFHITNSVGRRPCQSRRPTWKFYIFAPKSSQTMSPQIKLYLLYYFPIMHFDASTKFQIWWCIFFAEVQKTTLAGCIEDLEGFVS